MPPFVCREGVADLNVVEIAEFALPAQAVAYESMVSRNPMMSSTQMIQASSASSLVLVVSEKVTANTIGTTSPTISAPRLSLGYSASNRATRRSMDAL